MTNPQDEQHDVQLNEPLEFITSTQALVPVKRRRELPPAVTRQYPQMKGYQWYELENERALEPLLDALETAQELQWRAQIPIVLKQIGDLWELDQDHYHKYVADELLATVQAAFPELGYPGRYYHTPLDFTNRSSVDDVGGHMIKKKKLFGDEYRTVTLWRYVRAADYGVGGEQLPPHAYKVTEFIRKQLVQPHAWWVAVLLKIERDPRPTYGRNDPLLCVSFGRWVLAVAQWE